MEYSVDLKGMDKLLNKLEAATKEEVIKQSLNTSVQKMIAFSQQKRFISSGGLRGATNPTTLTSRSGRLRGSISASKAVKEGDSYIAKYGTNVKYARIHEYGGTIVPKVGKFLVFKVLGSLRYRSARTGARLKSPVGQYNTIFATKVRIPARPFLRPAIENKDNQEFVVNTFKENIDKAIERA